MATPTIAESSITQRCLGAKGTVMSKIGKRGPSLLNLTFCGRRQIMNTRFLVRNSLCVINAKKNKNSTVGGLGCFEKGAQL